MAALKIDIPNFKYSDKDYIRKCQSWDELQENRQPSKFDELLHTRWHCGMEQGIFNYKMDLKAKKQRIISGKHKYVLCLSLDRAKKRRAPEQILKVNTPFNPNKFHFNKIGPEEVLMSLEPQQRLDRGDTDKDSGGNLLNGAVQNNATSEDEEGQADQESSQTEGNGRHVVVINKSPFEDCHLLLVPDVTDCIQQRVTLRGLQMALHMILLSSHPGFRVAFNGLCALASVNHQHLHGWYMDTPLRIEEAPVRHVAGLCYEMLDMPTRAFAFQLHECTVEELARAVFTVTDYFQCNDVAHNMFITRGTTFGAPLGTAPSTVRVYLWPRKHFIGVKTEDFHSLECPLFHVAVAELAGHIPMYQPDRYDDLTEEEIINNIQGSLLSDGDFNALREKITELMAELTQERS